MTDSPEIVAVAVAVVPIPTPICGGADIDTVGIERYPLPPEILNPVTFPSLSIVAVAEAVMGSG